MAQVSSLEMVAVGDVMLGDSSYFIGRGVGSQIRKFGPDFPFAEVSGFIRPADLFFANLESPLSRELGASSWERVYRGTAEAAEGLQLADKNVVSVANNHILEHGQQMLTETHTILASYDIGCAGYGDFNALSPAIWRSQVNGLTISLFAVSLIKEFSGIRIDPPAVLETLAKHLKQSTDDVKIVSVHWGNEYVTAPSAAQIGFGRGLIDAGAALVLGHHPHVLQPIEEYGDGLIAYSLGNFVFDQDWGPLTRGGGMLKMTLAKDAVQQWEFVPTVTDSRCQPRLAAGRTATTLQEIVRGEVGLSEQSYQDNLAKRTREYRVRMKMELARHFWRVTYDTVHFHLTKKNRPRPVL